MPKWARLATVSQLAKVLFKNPPGPSPWYLRGNASGVPGCRWEDAGDTAETSGAVMLVRGKSPVLLLDFYNYALLVAPGTLLIWHQDRDAHTPTAPIVLRVFRSADLKPLDGDVEKLCRQMRRRKAPFLAAAAPLAECAIPTTTVNRERAMVFPAALEHIDELLMLCRSSGVKEKSRSNLAIAVVRPADGRYQLYPQDWWNDGEWDYSYEWVTRVARDPKTKQIHGDGIRIGPFVLDDSQRKLAP